jgi:glucose-6-phosphate 1-epimerase
LAPGDDLRQGLIGEFELFVKVTLGEKSLTQQLEVINSGKGELQFTTALHTYFRVADVSQASVEGLSGNKYLDNLQDRKEFTDNDASIQIRQETDRIYVGTADTLKLIDGGNKRNITLKKRNFPDAVVWNPWIDKAKGMADFGDQEYKEMVCVEAALASSGPVKLAPEQSWSAQQDLTAESTS